MFSRSSILIVVFACLSTISIISSFTIDLIHRDSSHSPFYNPHETPYERMQNAIKRSRFHPFRNSSLMDVNGPQSDVTAINGNYLMKLSFGTPPLDMHGIVDTGSDLVWIQCLPCIKCNEDYKPIFRPAESSTYNNIPCDDESCRLLSNGVCPKTAAFCNYTIGYGGGDYTDGVVARETITFGSTSGQEMSIENIIFGCGNNVTVPNTMGLIGLGRGPASLVSQLGSRIGSRRFSHCLVPFHTSPDIASKMTFGSQAVVSGQGTITTPLVNNDDSTFYYITLNGISVQDKFVPFSSNSIEAPKGNMFIDSGTVQPVIPPDFYKRLVAEIKKSIQLQPSKDDGIQLCYETTDHNFAPTLTIHFDGGDLKLKRINTFIQQYPENLFCFAMAPTDPQWSNGIYGNFFQYDFLMGLDLEKKTVSIKPTDCIKA